MFVKKINLQNFIRQEKLKVTYNSFVSFFLSLAKMHNVIFRCLAVLKSDFLTTFLNNLPDLHRYRIFPPNIRYFLIPRFVIWILIQKHLIYDRVGLVGSMREWDCLCVDIFETHFLVSVIEINSGWWIGPTMSVLFSSKVCLCTFPFQTPIILQ